MPYFDSKRTRLHYETTGSGADNIIFIHGNFASWRWWAPQFSSLPKNYTAYALDLRGCGDSEQPEMGYDLETLVSDIEQLITHLGLETFHLVGHSLGGALVQEFSCRFPEKVTSLILVAPVPASGLASLQNKKASNFLSDFLSPENFYSVFSYLGLQKPLIRQGLQKSMPGSEHWSEFETLVEIAAKMSPNAFSGFLALLDRWQNPAPKKITCPVLLVHGELDPVIPPQELIPMEKQLPNCRRVCWPWVGHAPQLERPKGFSTLLFNFIHATEKPGEKGVLPLIPEEEVIPDSVPAPITQRIIQWLKKRFK
jgi:pimeloyl-ACP methyl ester carboxylesterase